MMEVFGFISCTCMLIAHTVCCSRHNTTHQVILGVSRRLVYFTRLNFGCQGFSLSDRGEGWGPLNILKLAIRTKY